MIVSVCQCTYSLLFSTDENIDENFGINVQFEESEEEDLDEMQGEVPDEAEDDEEGEEPMETQSSAIHANVRCCWHEIYFMKFILALYHSPQF